MVLTAPKPSIEHAYCSIQQSLSERGAGMGTVTRRITETEANEQTVTLAETLY